MTMELTPPVRTPELEAPGVESATRHARDLGYDALGMVASENGPEPDPGGNGSQDGGGDQEDYPDIEIEDHPSQNGN